MRPSAGRLSTCSKVAPILPRCDLYLSDGCKMDNAARPRTYAQALERLRRVGLRPTRQRLALVKLLFEQGDRHITAEQLHEEAQGAGVRISSANVYTSLHQSTEVGLLREGVVEPDHSCFDTNTTDHHHFCYEDD